jgi:hypothetical protein
MGAELAVEDVCCSFGNVRQVWNEAANREMLSAKLEMMHVRKGRLR